VIISADYKIIWTTIREFLNASATQKHCKHKHDSYVRHRNVTYRNERERKY